MHGWLPITVQAIAALVLIAAIGWRNRRWRLVWLPWAALVGVGARGGGALVHRFARAGATATPHRIRCGSGSGSPASRPACWSPGWRGARWWRRGVSVLAVPLCVLCAALALNLWVGYFPTVQNAWNQLTAGPLPDQTDQATVTAMQQNGMRSRRRAPSCR